MTLKKVLLYLLGPHKIRDNKNSCWCGWDSLPPGFQFPVKELVASLKNLRGVAKTPLFWYNSMRYFII